MITRSLPVMLLVLLLCGVARADPSQAESNKGTPAASSPDVLPQGKTMVVSPATANINAGGHKITNGAAASTPGDFVVQDQSAARFTDLTTSVNRTLNPMAPPFFAKMDPLWLKNATMRVGSNILSDPQESPFARADVGKVAIVPGGSNARMTDFALPPTVAISSTAMSGQMVTVNLASPLRGLAREQYLLISGNAPGCNGVHPVIKTDNPRQFVISVGDQITRHPVCNNGGTVGYPIRLFSAWGLHQYAATSIRVTGPDTFEDSAGKFPFSDAGVTVCATSNAPSFPTADSQCWTILSRSRSVLKVGALLKSTVAEFIDAGSVRLADKSVNEVPAPDDWGKSGLALVISDDTKAQDATIAACNAQPAGAMIDWPGLSYRTGTLIIKNKNCHIIGHGGASSAFTHNNVPPWTSGIISADTHPYVWFRIDERMNCDTQNSRFEGMSLIGFPQTSGDAAGMVIDVCGVNLNNVQVIRSGGAGIIARFQEWNPWRDIWIQEAGREGFLFNPRAIVDGVPPPKGYVDATTCWSCNAVVNNGPGFSFRGGTNTIHLIGGQGQNNRDESIYLNGSEASPPVSNNNSLWFHDERNPPDLPELPVIRSFGGNVTFNVFDFSRFTGGLPVFEVPYELNGWTGANECCDSRPERELATRRLKSLGGAGSTDVDAVVVRSQDDLSDGVVRAAQIIATRGVVPDSNTLIKALQNAQRFGALVINNNQAIAWPDHNGSTGIQGIMVDANDNTLLNAGSDKEIQLKRPVGAGGAGGVPKLTGGCDGKGSTIAGTDNRGTVTTQTSAPTTRCTIAFNHTFAETPICTFTDAAGSTSPVAFSADPANTTPKVASVRFASGTGLKFNYRCD